MAILPPSPPSVVVHCVHDQPKHTCVRCVVAQAHHRARSLPARALGDRAAAELFGAALNNRARVMGDVPKAKSHLVAPFRIRMRKNQAGVVDMYLPRDGELSVSRIEDAATFATLDGARNGLANLCNWIGRDDVDIVTDFGFVVECAREVATLYGTSFHKPF